MNDENANPDVDDWLFDFMVRHQMRYRPFDWPDLATDEGILFLEVWSHAFRKHALGPREADDASIGLGESPPKYRGDHLPAILRAVHAERDRRASQFRVHSAPAPEPVRDPIVLPEGVSNFQEYWRHLTGTNARKAR